jgi:hypothetical protein
VTSTSIRAGQVDPVSATPAPRGRGITGVVERAAWPAFCVVAAIWAAGYATWPFSSDQGILSWVGRVIADGGMPYRDAWEIRGPFPFIIYAAIARLFGAAEWPLRVVDLAILCAGALCIARIAGFFAGRTASRCAVALYVLWYASLGHHDTAQSDGWNGAMIAGVVAAMFARGGRPTTRHALVAGLLLGASILSKPTYAVFLLLPGIIGLAQVRERGAAWLARFWGAGVFAIAVSAGAILLWLYRGGAFSDFVDVHLRWLLTRYTDVESGWLNRVQTALLYLTSSTFATAIAPAAVGLYVVWKQRRDLALVLAAWLGGAVVTVMAQGNFYPYHWHPVYSALATIGGVGVAVALGARSDTTGSIPRIVGYAVAASAFVAAALYPLVHLYRIALLATGLMPREQFDTVEFSDFGRTGVFAQLSDYLRAHTTEAETVLVWGSVPGVYYEARREAATRFGYAAPLVNSQDDEFRRRYRREFMARLDAVPPSYVAVLAPAICEQARTIEERRLLGKAEERMKCAYEIPELEQFIAQRYAPDTAIGPIVVYRRR